MQSLDTALIEGEIPALIGAPGLGKTLLLQRVAARLDDRTAPVYVPYSTLTLPELCKLVLGLVEEPVTDDPEEALRHIIGELRRQRASLLLLIDDAAMMPRETALQLAEWVEASKGALKLALAAVESPEARKVFEAFGDRLHLIRLDEEMSLQESREYILRRLAIAGAPDMMRDAFDEETIELLHLEAHGNPRAINVVAQSVVRATMPDDAPLLEEIYDPSLYDIAVEEPAPFEPETRSVRAEAAAAEIEESILIEPDAANPVEALCDTDSVVAAPDDNDCGSYRVVRGRRVKNAEGDLGSYEGRSTVERIPAGAHEIAAQIDEEEGTDTAPNEPLEGTPAEILLEAEAAPTIQSHPAAEPKPARKPILAQLLELGDAISRQPTPAGISILAAIALGLACGSLFGAATVGTPGSQVPQASTTAPAPVQPVVAIFTTKHAIGINATPWALIEIDGTQVGETPIADYELTEGPHTFRAYFPDGVVEEKVVLIDESTRSVVFD
jgi:type II secretory pathway predicted ATPase ExeA